MRYKVFTDDNYELVLIRASSLYSDFDGHDLSMRQNSHVPIVDNYHENWIHNDVFLVPSFHIVDDRARVGNGRHRLTVLSKYMNEIPAAFERRYSSSNNIDQILESIVVRKLSEFEEIEFPELPIAYLGDDINGSPAWKTYIEESTI